MRILITTPVLPDRNAVGGGAVVMHGQVLAAAHQHDVTLATFAWGDPTDDHAIAGLRANGVDVHVVRSAWRRPSRLAVRWLRDCRPMRALQFQDPAMQRLLDRLLEERRFDLLQVEDSAMAAYAFETAERVPRVMTEHEVRHGASASATWAPRGALNLLARRLERGRWETYQRNAWRGFDRIQVFTRRDAQALGEIAPDVQPRARVNPFGMELPPLSAGASSADLLVFVGGFMHPPNVDAALWLGHEIMPRLKVLHPSAHLLIVGSYPPASVRALASDSIGVTGRVAAVEPYLDKAAAVVAPLRQGGGMRVKVLQAMAHGKAVVTTPLGAEGLTLPDPPAPLVVADSAERFADQVAALLRDHARREDLGTSARAFVEQHFSWEAYRRRIEALYAELAPGRAGAAA